MCSNNKPTPPPNTPSSEVVRTRRFLKKNRAQKIVKIGKIGEEKEKKPKKRKNVRKRGKKIVKNSSDPVKLISYKNAHYYVPITCQNPNYIYPSLNRVYPLTKSEKNIKNNVYAPYLTSSLVLLLLTMIAIVINQGLKVKASIKVTGGERRDKSDWAGPYFLPLQNHTPNLRCHNEPARKTKNKSLVKILVKIREYGIILREKHISKGTNNNNNNNTVSVDDIGSQNDENDDGAVIMVTMVKIEVKVITLIIAVIDEVSDTICSTGTGLSILNSNPLALTRPSLVGVLAQALLWLELRMLARHIWLSLRPPAVTAASWGEEVKALQDPIRILDPVRTTDGVNAQRLDNADGLQRGKNKWKKLLTPGHWLPHPLPSPQYKAKPSTSTYTPDAKQTKQTKQYKRFKQLKQLKQLKKLEQLKQFKHSSLQRLPNTTPTQGRTDVRSAGLPATVLGLGKVIAGKKSVPSTINTLKDLSTHICIISPPSHMSWQVKWYSTCLTKLNQTSKQTQYGEF